MNKKIRRILSMALLLALVIALLPAPGLAADDSSARADMLRQEVRDLHIACRKAAGLYSFDGYCGTLVSWQLYLMGITAEMISANGNTHYDNFKNLTYSSGGFRVRAYPAKDYSLEEALKLLTANGTQDAYNILVGFEWTRSQQGRLYGHALFIYAIADGTVYFSESFSTQLAGKFYSEGTPIACSIEEFCKYYSSWATLDGVVHFGLKTYADSCTEYAAYLYAGILQQTGLYTAPCTEQTDDRSALVRTLQPGERMCVTGLYRNTEGEYWYKVEDTQTGYVRAEDTRVLSMLYDDVTVADVGAPTELWQGRGFDVRGRITAKYNKISTVRAQVYAYTEQGDEHVMSALQSLNGQHYSLSGTTLSNQLAFRKLDTGSYRYELAVVIGNYYYADGQLQTEWKTLKLWRADFRVVTKTSENYTVSFDAAGGTASLNAAQVAGGDYLSVLPEAQREGYLFDGWYTHAGTEVTAETEITADMPLVAHWVSPEDLNGWYLENGSWVYLENGQPKTGLIRSGDVAYYINEDGSLATGWVTVDRKLYYFYGNGAMHTGWLEGEEGMYYFTATGAAIGWMYIGGNRYYFNENGLMLTDPAMIDGVIYYFGDDGILRN